MSFLSDLFHGNFSNLGHDLNPSNIFSDTGSDFKKQPSWLQDVELIAPAAIGTALTFGADLPALAGGLSGALGLGSTAADTGAALTGSELATADTLGGWLDTTSFGSTLDTAVGEGGATLPASAGLTSGTTVGFGGAEGGTSGLTTAAAPATSAATTDASAWPASYDLGGTTAVDVGGGGSPLSLSSGIADTGGKSVQGGTGIFDKLSSFGKEVGSDIKAATPFIGAAGLGYSLYSGYETNQANSALKKSEAQKATDASNLAATESAAASPLLSQGSTLTSYITTGTLPASFQSSLDQQVAAAKAAIIQGYASRGMSTNPQQNSQLTQELANVDSQAQTQKANMEQTLQTAGNQMIQTANSLLSSGLSATSLSAQIPIQMSKLDTELNAAMSSSISNFAAAINGTQSGKNITLNLGGGGVTS